MKLFKTRIALAISLCVGLHSYTYAAWYDGGDYNSSQDQNGGTGRITGDLTINAQSQYGLRVRSGANFTSDNVNIKIDMNSSNNGVHALAVYNSNLDLRDAESVNITNNSRGGHGVYTSGGAANVQFGNGVVIRQTNDNQTYVAGVSSHAAGAYAGGTLTFMDYNIFSTSAVSGSTLFAINAGSSITIGNFNKLETHGDIGHGAHSVTGATVELGNNNQIEVYGNGSRNLYAQNTGSKGILGDNNTLISYGGNFDHPTAGVLNAGGIFVEYSGEIEIGQNNKIITYGEDSRGINVIVNSKVEAGEGTSILVSGNFSRGINTMEVGHAILGGGTTVITSGDNARTVYANDRSSIEIGDGSVIEARGQDSYAVTVNNNSTVTLTGRQSVYAADGYSFVTGGQNGKIIADGQLTVGGDIASRVGNNVIDLTFHDGSTFTGASYARSGVANPDNFTGTLNMDMTGTRWNMTDTSHVTNLTMDNSHVYFNWQAVPSVHLNVANLEGNATGVGGIFHMHSFVETGDIENGGSGTNITDKLIVTGADAANGDHKIVVADRGGAITNGKETLTIIETQGGDHDFSMYGYNEQGAYLYGLRRTEGNPNNWELYGTGIIADTPKTGIDSIGARYRLGLHENQTLLQRLGDLRNSPEGYGAWVKLHGGEIKGKTTTATAGYDLDYFGVQLGVDKKLQDDWLDGEVYLGLWGGYTKGDVDYYSTHSGDIKNYFVGLYATYMDETNTYADLVLKYGKQKNTIEGYSSQGSWVKGSDRTDMYSASLEVGRRFHFERNQLDEGFYFEPQAQLSLNHYGSGDITFNSGLSVKNESFDSLVGRLGANVGIERKYGDTPYNAYVKVSYQKEIDGDVAVRFNNDPPQKIDFGDDWWTYGVGVTAKLSDKHSIYMDIERSSASDLFKQSWRGNVGYRYEF